MATTELGLGWSPVWKIVFHRRQFSLSDYKVMRSSSDYGTQLTKHT